MNNFLATCAELAQKHDRLYCAGGEQGSGYLTVSREFSCCNPERFEGPSVHLTMERFNLEFKGAAYSQDDYRRYIIRRGVFWFALLPTKDVCGIEEMQDG